MNVSTVTSARQARACALAQVGGDVARAVSSGALPKYADLTLSEALVLGLLKQGVRRYVAVFGHGSTEVAEVLRVYEEAGLVRTYGVHSEIEASHAATALRWVTGEKAAVVTSIGPGALQALAASLVPASDGIGVWYLFGDETTEDEGPNMQQIPKAEQALYLRLATTMGAAYTLHTPEALPTALRRGLNVVDHPYSAGPFYLLLPMNRQARVITGFNLDELPSGAPPRLGPAAGDYAAAAAALEASVHPIVRIGGGAAGAGRELAEFLDLSGAVAVLSPRALGVIPYDHPRNMTVGGSKGSICGNYAMEQADLLVAVGSRAVCQSDCSRTGYPNVKAVININADLEAALHYGRTIPLLGDAAATLGQFNEHLRATGRSTKNGENAWTLACLEQRRAWEQYKAARYAAPALEDPMWAGLVLTQPAAVKVTLDWARHHDAPVFFDAGDVQAHGFQASEDDRLGRTYSDTGATYMGFASSAILATAFTDYPFYGVALTGDGSFMMNPQILLDGVVHGVRGAVVILDNRRMGAISGLQMAQYGEAYATFDGTAVDYVRLAGAVPGVLALKAGASPASLLAALDAARDHPGLSVIHVPVYYGPHELGHFDAFGRWNIGIWSDETEALRHKIGL
jgi:3D-(3,5/4)-trihydroxycyclohexane-1,2-dione acylhydrolase (decyclizing)